MDTQPYDREQELELLETDFNPYTLFVLAIVVVNLAWIWGTYEIVKVLVTN